MSHAQSAVKLACLRAEQEQTEAPPSMDSISTEQLILDDMSSIGVKSTPNSRHYKAGSTSIANPAVNGMHPHAITTANLTSPMDGPSTHIAMVDDYSTLGGTGHHQHTSTNASGHNSIDGDSNGGGVCHSVTNWVTFLLGFITPRPHSADNNSSMNSHDEDNNTNTAHGQEGHHTMPIDTVDITHIHHHPINTHTHANPPLHTTNEVVPINCSSSGSSNNNSSSSSSSSNISNTIGIAPISASTHTHAMTPCDTTTGSDPIHIADTTPQSHGQHHGNGGGVGNAHASITTPGVPIAASGASNVSNVSIPLTTSQSLP